MLTEDQSLQLQSEGFYIVENALSSVELMKVRKTLDATLSRLKRKGVLVTDVNLDPNECNVRLYNLPQHDPLFVEMVCRPDALEAVNNVLGPHFILSNFTGNIALPGSGSMALHADQALVVPPPWNDPWAVNIIWCLDDIRADNGATLYLPGSHLYRSFEDVPADAASMLRPFAAPAGSFIVMEGRLWHTSGPNITSDEQRRLLFAYYTMDFVRPSINWEAALSTARKKAMSAEERQVLGMGAAANIRMGAALTSLRPRTTNVFVSQHAR